MKSSSLLCGMKAFGPSSLLTICRSYTQPSNLLRQHSAGGISSSSSGSSSSHIANNLGSGNSQILGAAVPSFRHFPYKSSAILHLYKDFLSLIFSSYAPHERGELLFRLRNEFQSKKHLTNPRMIMKCLKRGEGILALQKQIEEKKRVRRSFPQAFRNSNNSIGDNSSGGINNVDAAWESFQYKSNSVLPGLQNVEYSVPITRGGYLHNDTARYVGSRRK